MIILDLATLLSDTMESLCKNRNGYTSCIKIAGIPILPPVITEERKIELNEDKKKALEIEKKLQRKRNSIDSGVMTESYTDYLKTSENGVFIDAGLTNHASYKNVLRLTPSEAESFSSDTFLKAALEDREFREFFYSTAEQIFKDNNLVNTNPSDNNSFATETNVDYTCEVENDSDPVVDSILCNNVSFHHNDGESDKSKNLESCDNENTPAESEKQQTPQPQLIRKNSYTLESPSPVLLEHMAKENSDKQEDETWKSLPENNNNLGFKTFPTVRKPRKAWNKQVPESSYETSTFLASKPIHSSDSKAPRYQVRRSKTPKFHIKRSTTFIKTNSKCKQTNCSLPCSSRASPIELCELAQSVECIQSLADSPPNSVDNNTGSELNFEPESLKEEKSTKTHLENEAYVDKSCAPDGNPETALSSCSHSTLMNNNNFPLFSNTAALLPSEYEPKVSSSQILPQIQQYYKANTFSERTLSEIDESASVCSCLSLSRFMAVDENVSRPSTAGELPELLSELQLRHERQIKELLGKQHKEKLMLSKYHLSSVTSSNASTSNLSVSDLPSEKSGLTHFEGKRTPCSRELFPSENNSASNREQPKKEEFVSEKEQAAAVKITACVRGYLTRRLLKTEKVQQLIDTIKESLDCAFSLQSEAQLKRNDLELHERLAHQLTAALYELQTIISAPVARRMAVIAADRERLRKPPSRPSSAISSATRKSLLRRQKSSSSTEDKAPPRPRTRTKSLCSITRKQGAALSRSESFVKSDSSSTSSQRRPWK